MNELLEWLKNITLKDLVALFPYIGAVLLWVWRKWIMNVLSYCKQILTVPSTLQKLHSLIEHELQHNGGSSIKDQMTRTLTTVSAIENRLILNEERVHTLMSQNQYPIWESDIDGRYIWANDTFMNLLRRPFSDLKGAAWKSVIFEKDAERVFENWESAIREKRKFYLTYHLVRSDGLLVRVRADGRVLKNDAKNGEVQGFIGIVHVLKDGINPDDYEEA
jgi:PAS domain-containing protein